jgi:hypothetical protein
MMGATETIALTDRRKIASDKPDAAGVVSGEVPERGFGVIGPHESPRVRFLGVL